MNGSSLSDLPPADAAAVTTDARASFRVFAHSKSVGLSAGVQTGDVCAGFTGVAMFFLIRFFGGALAS